jgi:hypothetical protein
MSFDPVTASVAAAASVPKGRDVLSILDGPQRVDRSGVVSSHVAMQANLNAAANEVLWSRKSPYGTGEDIPVCKPIVIPYGDYRTSQKLTIPRGVDVVVDYGARVRATAAMTALVDTDVSQLYQRQTLDVRGTLDCNGFAQTGLYLRYFVNFKVPQLNVYNPAGHAVILGDTAAASTSYEATFGPVDISRPKGAGVPTGSRGLWLRYATDSSFTVGRIVGMDIGVRNDRGGNVFVLYHPWGFAGEEPSRSFEDFAGNARYVAPEADSPTQYGFYLGGSGTMISDLLAYRNASSPDNIGTAVFLGGEVSSPVHAISGRVQGESASHRWAKDIDATTASDMLGVSFEWVGGLPNVASRWNGLRQMGSVPNISTLALQAPASGANDLLQHVASNRQVMGRNRNSGDQAVGIGGRARAVSRKTGNYTLTNADDTIISDAATATTITLPAANSSSINTGRAFTIRSVNAGSVTVATAGGNVEGATSTQIAAGGRATFMTDGTNWWIV